MMKLIKFVKQRHIRYRFIDSLLANSIVVDLGCGEGSLQKDLRNYRKDLKFISVDKEDFSIKFSPHVFIKADISNQTLPIDSQSVDAVFCSHVFEHLHSYNFALAEIKRILKPNASVYIETPSTRSIFLPSFGLSKEQNSPINFYDDPTHLRPFTHQSLHRLGKEIGFKKIRTGFARNWVSCLFSPIGIPYSIISKNRRLLASFIWHITGWCVYLWGKYVDK